MIGLIQAVSSFVLVLGILIFVHEFGHFIVAKWLRISVPVFSLGLGPRLVGFRRGETDYRISLIPLGGYVRMAGDEADEYRSGAPEEFLSRPKWQRFLVYVAGATLNILLAWLIVTGLLWFYGVDELAVGSAHPVVRSVEEGSPAARSGVLPGDRLLRIEDKALDDPSTVDSILLSEVTLFPDRVRELWVERDGEELLLGLQTGRRERDGMGDPGWNWGYDDLGLAVVESVLEGGVAEAAGIRPGDRFVGTPDGERLEYWALLGLLADSPGEALALRIERDGVEREVSVTPAADEEGKGKIGVAVRPSGLVHRDYTLFEAAGASVRHNLRLSGTLFEVLKRWVRRDIDTRVFSGPMEIARVSREAVSQGARTLLSLLAFISLQLGILNLLPIPVLDGGHILILGVEGLIGRDLHDRVKEKVMLAGLAALVAFFGLIIYRDVIKSFFSS